jgi:hypothetical protein
MTPPISRTVALHPVCGRARFTGCDDLLEGVLSILRGWKVRRLPAARRLPATMRVKRTPRGYRRVSPWRSTPSLVREKIRPNLVEAICGFHFELIDWYLRDHPDQLCIHGAAALFKPGLVVFPAVQRVGKSVLTVDLAHRGIPIYCDDVLPVDLATREGIALGILPRLRPPLPPDASRALHAFVAAHEGPHYRNRLYVAVPDDVMVPYGARAPIAGVVLLERKPGVRPSIEDVDPAEALEAIILQNFALEAPPERVLDTLLAIVSGASCRRLRYERAEQGAALLIETFGRPGESARTRRRVTPRPESAMPRNAKVRTASKSARKGRSPAPKVKAPKGKAPTKNATNAAGRTPGAERRR